MSRLLGAETGFQQLRSSGAGIHCGKGFRPSPSPVTWRIDLDLRLSEVLLPGVEKSPQHGMQDPTIAVVVDFYRGVQTGDDRDAPIIGL
jgi:hypothetical protein